MGILVLVGLGVGGGFFLVLMPILLYRGVPQMTLVGIGFVVGGVVFCGVFVGFDIISIHRSHHWKQVDAVIGRDWKDSSNSDHPELVLRLGFHTASGQIQVAQTHGPEDVVWKAVQATPDENGAKLFRGSRITVLYDPESPKDVVIKAINDARLWPFAVLMGGMFIPTGIALLYKPVRNRVWRKRLLRTGTSFPVTIDDIRQDESHARRSGEDQPMFHPWIIKAEWVDPETKRKHHLLSGPLWDDPQDTFREGGKIDVVMDLRRSPALYALDTRPLGEPWIVKALRLGRRP